MVRYAEYMGMSKASLSNKAVRGSWNSDDLIKLSELTNTKLAFIDENNQPIIIFDSDDLNKKKQTTRSN